MENQYNANKEYGEIIPKQRKEPFEKNVKEHASSSNDETLDAESNEKST